MLKINQCATHSLRTTGQDTGLNNYLPPGGEAVVHGLFEQSQHVKQSIPARRYGTYRRQEPEGIHNQGRRLPGVKGVNHNQPQKAARERSYKGYKGHKGPRDRRQADQPAIEGGKGGRVKATNKPDPRELEDPGKRTSSVGQVNLGKRRAAVAEANKRRYDVLLITEPHTAFGKVVGLEPRGMVYATSKDTPRACIRTPHKAWLMEEFTDADIAAVAVVGEDKDLVVFASVYLDITSAVEKELWLRLIRWCEKHSTPLVMGVDANAHSPMWGCPDLNDRGSVMEEVIMVHDLSLLNRGHVETFTGGGGTIIDLTLTNRWFDTGRSSRGWMVDLSDSLSDHRYIQFEITQGLQHRKGMSRNVKRTDWAMFRQILEVKPMENMSPLDRPEEALEHQAGLFQGNILDALEAACPMSEAVTPQTNKWWSPELQKLRQEVNKTGRRKNKHPDLHEAYLRARRAYTKAIQRAKKEAWRNFCSKAKTAGDVAKLVKCLEAKAPSKVSLFLRDGESVTPEDSLGVLMHTHFPGSQEGGSIPPPTMGVEDFTGVVQYINDRRVKMAIDTFDSYKSAGPDGIQPAVLKKLPNGYIQRLTLMYQLSLATGVIPTCWREMRVTFIPKAGKGSYADPKAYRPITLSSFVLKTLERLVQWFINDHIIIRPLVNQHAYTRGRSTETALSDFIDLVEAAFLRGRQAVAVSLDCTGAFDTVKFDSARTAMRGKSIPPNIVQWYDHLLRNRRVTAEVQGVSKVLRPGKGSPQGGVLSPLVWNLVMDTLLTQLEGGPVKAIGYADDVLLVATGIEMGAMETQMQRALDTVAAWGLAQGLVFNPAKTAVVHFNPGREGRGPVLSLKGSRLEGSESLKYLGVTVHKKLRWEEHLNERLGKCRRLLQGTKALIGQHWGLDPQKCLWVYRAMVRPKLTYGSLVWAHALNKGQRGRLQKLQRLALLSIAHPMRSAPTKGLEVLLGLVPLDLFAEREATKARLRIRSGDKKGDTKRRWDGLGFNPKKKGHQRHWDDVMKETIPDDEVSDHMAARLNDFRSTAVPEPEIVIYTDGSANAEGNGGYGWLACKGDTIVHEASGGLINTSAFQAEVVALGKAAEWASQWEKAPRRIKMISDSASALEAVTSNMVTSTVVWESARLLRQLEEETEVQLEWVKGHSNTTGNEVADLLAKRGHKEPSPDTLPTSSHTLKKRINKLFEEKWQKRWDEETTCKTTRSMLPKVAERRLSTCGLNRAKLNLLSQAVTGHGFLASHLSKWRNVDPVCKLCEEGEETSLHLWRDCSALEQARIGTTPEDALEQIGAIYDLFSSGQVMRILAINEGELTPT